MRKTLIAQVPVLECLVEEVCDGCAGGFAPIIGGTTDASNNAAAGVPWMDVGDSFAAPVVDSVQGTTTGLIPMPAESPAPVIGSLEAPLEQAPLAPIVDRPNRNSL
jgi:hypothetical protein